MFCQVVPGSEQTWDEYMNAPIEKVADACWEMLGAPTKERALDVYDADPERFRTALGKALERHSAERKGQRLREEIGMMTDEDLHQMSCDPNLNQRTRYDIEEEVRDRKIRGRIVGAAVRAIQNDTPNCWSDDLPDSDKLHVVWKPCEQCILHGTSGPLRFEVFMDFKRNSASTSALSACMEKVEKAKSNKLSASLEVDSQSQLRSNHFPQILDKMYSVSSMTVVQCPESCNKREDS